VFTKKKEKEKNSNKSVHSDWFKNASFNSKQARTVFYGLFPKKIVKEN